MRIGIAHGHFFLGRHDEATAALNDNPDYQAGIRIGAASDAMVRLSGQAQKLAIRLQRLNLRVSNLKNVLGLYRRAPKTVAACDGDLRGALRALMLLK
ncbi:hypothetical protein [Bradyrhizobium sp. MOS002]|uniref:hypothetical protein n=1 Tax=Bradyrhizobium sp. MOS002 TaxID=2133947 RepID=UPI000D11F28F|nr:hypothetical protein [Bradyrhizobium sp. MOS002]PSO19782.1 hypothetical protein C7G41_35305 [Bradyrhizobium sp. MOS002]